MKVAILGAGNGGCAAAADFTRRGFEVRLYSRSLSTLRPIVERGGVDYLGVIGNGFAPIDLITTNLGLAVEGADIIQVIAPQTAHAGIAADLAPHLRPDHVLLYTPGHTALQIAGLLRQRGVDDPVICETSTLPYAARVVGPATVRVSLEVQSLLFGVFPGSYAEALHDRVRKLYPGLRRAGTVLETLFLYTNAIHHPITSLCNVGRIESTGGDFLHYFEGITPSVGRLIDQLDAERLEIASRLGIETEPFVEYFHRIGYTTRAARDVGGAYEAFHQSEPDRWIKAPSSLDHRFIEEDVPYGLVPLVEFGRLAGVPAPTMSSVIQLASAMKRVDYSATGLTLARMGLEGVELSRLKAILQDGFGP